MKPCAKYYVNTGVSDSANWTRVEFTCSTSVIFQGHGYCRRCASLGAKGHCGPEDLYIRPALPGLHHCPHKVSPLVRECRTWSQPHTGSEWPVSLGGRGLGSWLGSGPWRKWFWISRRSQCCRGIVEEPRRVKGRDQAEDRGRDHGYGTPDTQKGKTWNQPYLHLDPQSS